MKKFSMNRSQRAKLARAVQDFNRKIYGHEVFINPVSYKEIAGKIKNTKTFNQEVNRLKRINNKGALDTIRTAGGYRLTRYEKNEIANKIRTINTLRSRYAKKLGIDKISRMTNEAYYIFNKRANLTDTIRHRGEYEKWVNLLERQSKKEYYEEMFTDYKKNIIKALKDNWPKTETRDRIEKLFRETEASKLWAAGADEDITDITFIYNALISDASLSVAMLRAEQEWKEKLGLSTENIELDIGEKENGSL